MAAGPDAAGPDANGTTVPNVTVPNVTAPDVTAPGPGGTRRERPGFRRAVRATSTLMIAAGLAVALFIGYELWFTNVLAARSQQHLRHQLTQTWARQPPRPAAAPVPPTDLGDGIALMSIPKIGMRRTVVIEGVGTSELKQGPGHYPGTAPPGQVGNFVVSGHRTTYGHPFGNLDRLAPNDPIIVEVADRWFLYRVTRAEVVSPDDVGVTLPVPEHPGVAPTAGGITLTTCEPKYSASHRLVVFGTLAETHPKSQPPPVDAVDPR
jgi:sortase A